VINNAMSLIAKAKSFAVEYGVDVNVVLQNYMFDRFLERISLSVYSDRFIVKGGFLIKSLIGLENRNTMDLDAALIHLNFTEENIVTMFENIIDIEIDDGMQFQYVRIERIIEGSKYHGFRVTITGRCSNIKNTLRFDVSTGDVITPRESVSKYKLLLEERHIEILSYNIETIMAEKLQTIISGGANNSRMKDFYDIYLLLKFRSDLNYRTLATALQNTCNARGTLHELKVWRITVQSFYSNDIMEKYWKTYVRKYIYVKEIMFSEVLKEVENVLRKCARAQDM
jgi:predicted nucleotidyltransferase component of viral defense system